MAKANLNPKQRKWVESFLSQHTQAKVLDIYSGLSGDRFIVIEWHEAIKPLLPVGCSDPGLGNIKHQIIAQLRIFGDLRCDARHKYIVHYPSCGLTPTATQLVEPTQIVLFEECQEIKRDNPAKAKVKKKQVSKRATTKPVQLTLPLNDTAYRLHQMSQAKGNDWMAKEQLLEAKETYYSLDEQRAINIPEALVDMLKNFQATHEEWEKVVGMFELCGLFAAMRYAEGLPYLRQLAADASNQVINQPVKTKTRETQFTGVSVSVSG